MISAFAGGALWVAAAIFVINCGFNRVGFSMMFPIMAPFFLLEWCYKKWYGLSTSNFYY